MAKATKLEPGRFVRVFKHTVEKAVKVELLPPGTDGKWHVGNASEAAAAIVGTGLRVSTYAVWLTGITKKKGTKYYTPQEVAAEVAAAAEIKWLVFWAETKTGRRFPSPRLVISREVYRKPTATGKAVKEDIDSEPEEVDI